MAAFVLYNADVNYNSVDLSDHVRSVELPVEVAAVDSTVMGDSTTHSLPGLKNSTVTVTFTQDYASSKTDVTLWTAYNGKTSHTLLIKPDTAAEGATNPMYTMTAYVQSYSPVSGAPGDLGEATVTFEISSGDVVRDVTP